jgi:hypothetical protein
MDDVPSVDYEEQARKIGMTAVEEEFNKVFHGVDYKKASDSGWLNRCAVSMPGKFNSLYMYASSYKLLERLPAWEALNALATQYSAQRDKRSTLEQKIRGVAYSVTTRKALVAALPEFEKYLPADEEKAIRTLPVVQNVVADFVKAGWPKDRKGVAA